MKWLLLLAGIVCNASASIFVKMAVGTGGSFSLFQPSTWLAQWRFLAGLSCYALAFMLYALALKHLPLNVAQPILTGGAIALVAVLSRFFFGEALPVRAIFGMAVIVAGIILIGVRD